LTVEPQRLHMQMRVPLSDAKAVVKALGMAK
jgi:hypothetical protein